MTHAAPGGAGKRHLAPCSNRDFDFYYEGLEDGRLLIQRCKQCAHLRNPPSPMCPRCQSVAWEAAQMSGGGILHSYTIHHHPPIPGYTMPHPVGVVTLDEGVRFVGALDAIPLETLAIGLRVRAEFLRRGAVASLRFGVA